MSFIRRHFSQVALAVSVFSTGCAQAQVYEIVIRPVSVEPEIQPSVLPSNMAQNGYTEECALAVMRAEREGRWVTKNEVLISCDPRDNDLLPVRLVAAEVRSDIESMNAWHRDGVDVVEECDYLKTENLPHQNICAKAFAWESFFKTPDALDRAKYRAKQDIAFRP